MTDAFLHVESDPPLAVPRSELTYRATRSGGAGGQHVNTSSTRIELTWNVAASSAPSAEQRAVLLERLATRLDGDGLIRVVASKHRSQHRNREEATLRLQALLQRALEQRKPRRRTRVPRAAKESRLQDKKRRSELKRQRGRVED
jgi:ribosome-associated protein